MALLPEIEEGRQLRQISKKEVNLLVWACPSLMSELAGFLAIRPSSFPPPDGSDRAKLWKKYEGHQSAISSQLSS
ncbi:MAG: hypothetical protein U0T82_07390 [Bacteroidales bacterium]